jgi:hypothetical protein
MVGRAQESHRPVRLPPKHSTGRRNYTIARHGTEWTVDHDDTSCGPFANERDAIVFAIRTAMRQERYGEIADVILKVGNGRALRVWRHGQYPFRL